MDEMLLINVQFVLKNLFNNNLMAVQAIIGSNKFYVITTRYMVLIETLVVNSGK